MPLLRTLIFFVSLRKPVTFVTQYPYALPLTPYPFGVRVILASLSEGVRTSYALRARGKQRGKERVINEGDRVRLQVNKGVILASLSEGERHVTPCHPIRKKGYLRLCVRTFLPSVSYALYPKGVWA